MWMTAKASDEKSQDDKWVRLLQLPLTNFERIPMMDRQRVLDLNTRWTMVKQEPYSSRWENKVDDNTLLIVQDDGSGYDGCHDSYCASIRWRGYRVSGDCFALPHMAMESAEQLLVDFKNTVQGLNE